MVPKSGEMDQVALEPKRRDPVADRLLRPGRSLSYRLPQAFQGEPNIGGKGGEVPVYGRDPARGG